MTRDHIETALEIAVDTLTRRARVLEAQDPEVAEALRTIATRIDLTMPVTERVEPKRAPYPMSPARVTVELIRARRLMADVEMRLDAVAREEMT